MPTSQPFFGSDIAMTAYGRLTSIAAPSVGTTRMYGLIDRVA